MGKDQPADLKRLLDVQFWTSICPSMSITENVSLSHGSGFGENINIRKGDWQSCKTMINTDAYFVYDSYFHSSFVDQLADCMRRVEEAGFDPVFCFVFDEFWDLVLQLDPILSDLVGEYDILPAVWAWFVRPDHQTAFPPHRDGVRNVAVDDEEHLDYLTIWIPLTNLDHTSSCISVLPASADPDYDKGTSKVRVRNMQDVRSLQAKKGSVFCWTIGLAHWGTRQTSFGEPRMSVGYFIQNPDADCLVPPALDPGKPLTLKHRIALIGRQIMDYSRTADDQLLQLASQMVELHVDSEVEE